MNEISLDTLMMPTLRFGFRKNADGKGDNPAVAECFLLDINNELMYDRNNEIIMTNDHG